MVKWVKSARVLKLLIANGLQVSELRSRHVNFDNCDFEMIRILVENGLVQNFFGDDAFSIEATKYQYLVKLMTRKNK